MLNKELQNHPEFKDDISKFDEVKSKLIDKCLNSSDKHSALSILTNLNLFECRGWIGSAPKPLEFLHHDWVADQYYYRGSDVTYLDQIEHLMDTVKEDDPCDIVLEYLASILTEDEFKTYTSWVDGDHTVCVDEIINKIHNDLVERTMEYVKKYKQIGTNMDW